jgi:hypothetical protein
MAKQKHVWRRIVVALRMLGVSIAAFVGFVLLLPSLVLAMYGVPQAWQLTWGPHALGAAAFALVGFALITPKRRFILAGVFLAVLLVDWMGPWDLILTHLVGWLATSVLTIIIVEAVRQNVAVLRELRQLDTAIWSKMGSATLRWLPMLGFAGAGLLMNLWLEKRAEHAVYDLTVVRAGSARLNTQRPEISGLAAV